MKLGSCVRSHLRESWRSARQLSLTVNHMITHVLETVDTGARSVCRLSRLSLEKHARAGMSIAAKLRPTQNAAVSLASGRCRLSQLTFPLPVDVICGVSRLPPPPQAEQVEVMRSQAKEQGGAPREGVADFTA